MSRACGETIGPRIHTCQFVVASGRCSGSNRPDQHNGSCPFMPQSRTRSTSNAISFPAIRSALSEAKRFRIGGRRLRPEQEPSPSFLVRSEPSFVTIPEDHLCTTELRPRSYGLKHPMPRFFVSRPTSSKLVSGARRLPQPAADPANGGGSEVLSVVPRGGSSEAICSERLRIDWNNRRALVRVTLC